MADKAIELAAQLWTLPKFSGRVMDPDFCEAIADAIRGAVSEAVKAHLEDLGRLRKEISVEKAERGAAERQRDENATARDLRWEELVAKQGELERMRKSKAEVAADRERWRVRAQKAEAATPAGLKAALDEVARLRTEISEAYQEQAKLRSKVDEGQEELRQARAQASTSGQRIVALEATARSMQIARDQADRYVADSKKLLREAADKVIHHAQESTASRRELRRQQDLVKAVEGALPRIQRIEAKEFKAIAEALAKLKAPEPELAPAAAAAEGS